MATIEPGTLATWALVAGGLVWGCAVTIWALLRR